MHCMKNKILVILAVLGISLHTINSIGYCEENGIPAEIPTMVKVSQDAINRIVCNGQFKDLIYPEDRGIMGRFSGNSAYVSFMHDGENQVVDPSEPVEIYAVCNGATYTIIAAPTKKINAVTIRLSDPKSKSVDENISRFQDMPLEKQVLDIIREAYNGVYPSSYKVTDNNKTINICKDLTLSLIRTVDVDGVGLRLKEFTINANSSVDIDEKVFMNSRVSNSLLALAIEKHQLSKGDQTRLFVIEKKGGVDVDHSDFGSLQLNFRMGEKK